MKASRTSIILCVLILSGLLTVFNNCGDSTMIQDPLVNDKTSLGSESEADPNLNNPPVPNSPYNGGAVGTSITLNSNKIEVPQGSTAQLTVNNGTAPYTFTVSPNSAGSVNNSTRVFTANQMGVATVTVVDATGASGNMALNVMQATSCPLPWGGTIAEGQSVRAYSSKKSTVCSSITRTCSGGTLSGSSSYQYSKCDKVILNSYTPPSSCFTGETLVLTADGSSKAIHKIKVGDQVVSGLDGSINKVTGIETPNLGERQLVGLNGGKEFFTPEHPFLTQDGWKSLDPEVAMKEHRMKEKVTLLKVGDKVKLNKVWVEVKSFNYRKDKATMKVYNLMLDGDHTYVANGYAVHNKQ